MTSSPGHFGCVGSDRLEERTSGLSCVRGCGAMRTVGELRSLSPPKRGPLRGPTVDEEMFDAGIVTTIDQQGAVLEELGGPDVDPTATP